MRRVPLPSTWRDCPDWWCDFVNQIRDEAPSGVDGGDYLDSHLRDVYHANLDDLGVLFENEGDYLAFKLKWMR